MTRRWSGPVVCTIDMLVSLVAAFIALAILVEDPKPTKAADSAAPGALTVQLFWGDAIDADIDLWVLAPGDRPVGYSNKDGTFFNLLRDDLGFANDTSGKNFEVAYSRALPAGEYVVNAHAYSTRLAIMPIPVKAVIQIRRPGGVTETVATVDAQLARAGEELTLVRFRLDEHGALVPGSTNNLPMPLRDVK